MTVTTIPTATEVRTAHEAFTGSMRDGTPVTVIRFGTQVISVYGPLGDPTSEITWDETWESVLDAHADWWSIVAEIIDDVPVSAPDAVASGLTPDGVAWTIEKHGLRLVIDHDGERYRECHLDFDDARQAFGRVVSDYIGG